MNKIIEYYVVGGGSVQGLEKNVKRLLKKGWEPLGGVCIHRAIAYQAMVIREGVLSDFQLARAMCALAEEEEVSA